MVCNNFDIIVREYMNLSDRKTLKAIAEAKDTNQEEQVLASLTERLYNKIVEKADQIDYNSISRSRGDITKIQNYDSLVECIEILYGIVNEYKESTAPLDIVNSAIDNIKKRTDLFRKAYTIHSPLPILTYNNMCLAIVNSISFLIATCIEYIKSPTATSFQLALDTVAYSKTMNNLLFESCNLFNEACKTSDFDKSMKVLMDKSVVKLESGDIKKDTPLLTDEEIKNDKDVIHDDEDMFEEATGGIIRNVGSALMFIIKLVIPLIRTLVYYFFSLRQTVSDFFFVQAQLIEMNAYELQYNSEMDPDKKKKVVDKQMNIANKFRNISNKWAINYTTAKNSTERMENKDDSEKTTIDDLDNDSDDSILF